MSNSRLRKRAASTRTDLLGYLYNTPNPSYYSVTPMFSSAYQPSREETADETHPNYPKEGGPFESLKSSTTFYDAPVTKWGLSYPSVNGPGGLYKSCCESALRVPVSSAVFPTSQTTYATTLGTQAWSRFRPTKPIVGLGQFFAELRHMPSSFMQGVAGFAKTYKGLSVQDKLLLGMNHLSDLAYKTTRPKGLSKAYLSWQFGWRPFLSDLRKWYESVKDVDRKIARLRSENGKVVRRKGTLVNSTTTTTSNLTGYCFRPETLTSYITQNRRQKIVTTHEKAWFVGAYRYYIPGLDNPNWGKLKAMQILYDVDVTPTLLYELMPWSWLIDWFTNLGSVIDGLSTMLDQNLSTKYAYLMYNKRVTTRFETDVTARLQVSSSGASSYTFRRLAADVVSESRTRVASTPFGFGLTYGGLSPYQVSILAALGISRLKF